MRKSQIGDSIENNVIELNLQVEPSSSDFRTATVAYNGVSNENQNILDPSDVRVYGDVDSNSGFNGDTNLKGLVIGTSCTTIGNNTFENLHYE